MKVSQLMTKKLITVGPMDSVEEATRLLHQRHVRHLLVIDRHKLVGILSDRDLHRALDSSMTRKKIMAVGGLYFLLEPILVEEIMTPKPKTINAASPAQDAARLMLEHRFGALPVLSQGKVVGVITETDLLQYFVTKLDKEEVATVKKRAKTSKKVSRRPNKMQRKPAARTSRS